MILTAKYYPLLIDLKWGRGELILKQLQKEHNYYYKDVASYIQTRNEVWLQDFINECGIQWIWNYICKMRK